MSTNNYTDTITDAFFNARMHELPPELFDRIKDLVFTPSSHVCPVEKGLYYPPAQLQVDSTTRESFAAKWYGGKDFIIPSELNSDNSCKQWLASLTRSHQEMIGTIYLDGRMLRDGVVNGTLLSMPDDALIDRAVFEEHETRGIAMLELRYSLRFPRPGEVRLFVSNEVFRMWVCRSLEEGRVGILTWEDTWGKAQYALMS